MKVLVCGATGFIGRNIAEYFADKDNYEVFGTYYSSKPSDYHNIKMIKVDLTDKDMIDKVINGMDIIIQAAATTSGAKEIVNKPYYHVTDNAVMNSLIFRSAFEHNIKHVIFFSCSVMYQSSDVPLKENDFDANAEIFPSYFGVGWTKVYIEKMCEFYSRISNTKYTAIRHSNIYGPYDKYDLERSHVFGATVTKIMTANEKDEIVVWGDGKEARDLIYISDLVDFVELAILKQKSAFQLYNVGSGETISVRDLVQKIITFSGKDISIRHDLSKPTLKTKLCLDTTKANKEFKWQAKIALNEGIKKTLDWYKTSRSLMI